MKKDTTLIKVTVLESFKCSMDGIGARKKLLKKGTISSVPKYLLRGLVDAKLVKETQDTEASAIEYSIEWYLQQGRDVMISLLEDNGEEVKAADMTDEELAEACIVLFSE